MARSILTAAILLAGLGAAQAQTTCYPRIGAFSGQYEGQCPNSSLKWTAFENTVGAFGRNCSDEPWSFNRTEKVFYNPKANDSFAMQDCYVVGRDQNTNALKAGLGSEAVRRFHENRIQRPETAAR
ncbi:hypothetical protein [Microvirga zambiensis]|uniref:hypothetical protein n=1 Tax=Microvirga zambiensis TaxID=1402137 RepID=UPI00191D2E0F|nr:hypothetical protein [Microvirga zambiensis]